MSSLGETVSRLIESNRPRLHGYISRRVGDGSVAEDLMQDTWLEVWRRMDTFDVERAGFWRFTRIWADFVLRRHWAESTAQRCAACPDADGRKCTRPDVRTSCVSGRVTAEGPAVPAAAAAVDYTFETVAASTELLGRLARCPRPPHELLVFGFSKLGWKPRDVVVELADRPLDELEVRLEWQYAFVVPAVHRLFGPLRYKLGRPLSEAMPDPRTRQRYPWLLACAAGTTTLREYFPAAAERLAEAAIVHWWHAVQRSLIAETRRGGCGELFEWMQDHAA